MKVILATHNPHKRDELIRLVNGRVEVEILPDDFPDIEETGDTLKENSAIKSRVVFQTLSQPSLADDTGLEVAALDGAPGVYTARYAGENASYDDNCRKLLADLDGCSDRRARFVTVLSFIDEDGSSRFFEGAVEGTITGEFRGPNGFGYDPIFEPVEGNGKTFAEMSSEEKNRISHRARAIAKFLEFLEAREKGTD